MTASEVLSGQKNWEVLRGDSLEVLRSLPDGCVQSVCTSPPYFRLRRYLKDGHPDKHKELGQESRPDCHGWATGSRCGECFVCKLTAVFREVRRVLRDDGTFWLNIAGSYANAGSRNNGTGLDGRRRGGVSDTDGTWEEASKSYGDLRADCKDAGWKVKDFINTPALLAESLRVDGWYFRSEITLTKLCCMPESVTDRVTRASEKLFLFTKEPKYYYDQEADKPALAGSSASRYSYALGGAKNEELLRRSQAGEGGVRTRPIGMRDLPEGRNLWDYWTDEPDEDDTPDNVWEWRNEPSGRKHYAGFPSFIPRRCLKLGTSRQESCASCGAPYRRITERERVTRERPNEYTKRTGVKGTGNSAANTLAGVKVVTKGWEPGCDCGTKDKLPCLVLDPFCGSGTTGHTARRMGLRFIGIELNEEYCEMSRKRIAGATPLFDD